MLPAWTYSKSQMKQLSFSRRTFMQGMSLQT